MPASFKRSGATPTSRPVRNVADGTYFLLSYVSSSDVVTVLVLIWMSMSPIPVLRLLLLVRLREFV
jgi:hypothetical protein